MEPPGRIQNAGGIQGEHLTFRHLGRLGKDCWRNSHLSRDLEQTEFSEEGGKRERQVNGEREIADKGGKQGESRFRVSVWCGN